MNKTFLLLAALFASVGLTTAQTLTIPDVEVLPGGKASFELIVNVPENSYAGFQFETTFPSKINYTEETTVSSDWDGSFLTSKVNYNGSASSNKLTPIPSGEIAIATAEIEVDDELALGEYEVTISNFEFLGYEGGAEDTKIDPVTFKVIVTDRMTLDENSTTAPAEAEDVNVKVKRTINANEWSTICLPFAMTTEQMKAAFGDDVILKNFTGYEIEEDPESGDVVGITVHFEDASELEDNHPYMIKTSKDITSFDVDGVDVDPEDNPTVAAVKRTKKQWSEMIGTYVANTEVPENCLFINGNKFYYSTGVTQMKAYRAYFDFYDVLSEVENAVRVIGLDDDNTTNINNAIRNSIEDGNYYNLKGQRVEKPSKGVYILNGKKVVVK